MKQVIVLKLEPSEDQSAQLLVTMRQFNIACQHVADVAFEHRCSNKIVLQRLAYRALREDFGLSSQMAVRAISKVADAYRRDRRIHLQVNLYGAMAYDQRICSFKGLTHVSLLTLNGRLIVPMRYGAYQSAKIDKAKGYAELIYRNDTFYLHVVIDMPTPPLIDPNGVIGVDLGIAQIASDSQGVQYSGEHVKHLRRQVRRCRAILQSKGTKSAKRHLRRINRRQSRFVRHINHVISKQIVQSALTITKALALEDLKGIRDRANGYGREMRWLLGNWAFDQLRQFVTYKAKLAGVPVIMVDPRDTSRTCAACGFCDKANRISQSRFRCLQCGREENADYNAALNIAARAASNSAYCFHTM